MMSNFTDYEAGQGEWLFSDAFGTERIQIFSEYISLFGFYDAKKYHAKYSIGLSSDLTLSGMGFRLGSPYGMEDRYFSGVSYELDSFGINDVDVNFSVHLVRSSVSNVSSPLIGGAGLLAFGLASMRRKSK